MSGTEILVPGGFGRSFTAAEGGLITIIDLHGSQAGDFVALAAADPAASLSGVQTRRLLRALTFGAGALLYASSGRAMFRVVEDSIGVHDFSVPACDASRYEVDFGIIGHRNCLDNLAAALARFGLSAADVPEPFNLFQNSPALEGGRTGVVDSASRPGERIVLQPLCDVICALSPCPQDIIPANGLCPTDMLVRIGPG